MWVCIYINIIIFSQNVDSDECTGSPNRTEAYIKMIAVVIIGKSSSG